MLCADMSECHVLCALCQCAVCYMLCVSMPCAVCHNDMCSVRHFGLSQNKSVPLFVSLLQQHIPLHYKVRTGGGVEMGVWRETKDGG